MNPYYPRYLADGLPWARVIDAAWAHRGRYVLPTPEQAEATARLVGWLTSPPAEGLAIPRAWRGVDGTRLAMDRVVGGDERRAGVWAHHYFHGLVAVLGWAFWRLSERKDRELKALHERLLSMAEVQTAAITKVEAALVALKEAIQQLRRG